MHQSIQIIGRLGRDPEMRYMPNGDPVTSINVATDRAWNDKNGGKQKETTWFRVSIFGKQAEIANQYLAKGRMVFVEGRLRTDAKTGGPTTFTRQDGTVGSNFEIVANVIRFLSPKDEGSPAAVSDAGGAGMDEVPAGEDIPF